MRWTALRILEKFWEYKQPRVGKVGPKGYERPSAPTVDVRFWAWLRVVTTPEYVEYEHNLAQGIWTGFLEILEESLKAVPFSPPEDGDGDPGNLKGALIPVTAACAYARVSQPTISRWIDRGLRHKKLGAYYWVSVSDLDRFLEMKGRHKVIRRRQKTKNSGQDDTNPVYNASEVA